MRKKFAYEIVTNVRLGGGTGRRTGLKIRSPERGVRVRFPPQALSFEDVDLFPAVRTPRNIGIKSTSPEPKAYRLTWTVTPPVWPPRRSSPGETSLTHSASPAL